MRARIIRGWLMMKSIGFLLVYDVRIALES